jgi:hypothetical protein
MKTDTELETLLRSALTARADAVQDAPPWVRPAGPVRRRRPWLPALAAAAAVVAVIAAVALGVHAARNRPAVPPGPTPTTVAVPRACPAALPEAWRSALRDGGTPLGRYSSMPLSVTGDGTIVAYRDAGVQPGAARDVVLLRPGRPPEAVYRVARPDRFGVQSAYLDGHRLVVALGSDPRHAPGVIPGSSPMPNVRRLLVIDLDTGATQTLASTTGDVPEIQTAVLLDHTVYWDVRAHYGASTGRIEAHSLETGTTRTVYRGPLGYLLASDGGIGWAGPHGYQVHVGVPLPDAVAAATDAATRMTLSTDGTDWAWLVSRGVVGYWRPGLTAPAYLRLREPVDTDDVPGSVVVSGRFVLAVGPAPQVIDVGARAAAPITGRHPFAGHARGQAALVSGGTRAAGYSIPDGPGHWVQGYWADPPTQLLVLDTAGLPALTC